MSLMKYSLHRWGRLGHNSNTKERGQLLTNPINLFLLYGVMLFCEKMAYSLRWKKKQQEQNEAQQKPDSGIKCNIIIPLEPLSLSIRSDLWWNCVLKRWGNVPVWMKEAKHSHKILITHIHKKKKKSSSTNICASALSRMKNEVLETVEGPTVLNYLTHRGKIQWSLARKPFQYVIFSILTLCT